MLRTLGDPAEPEHVQAILEETGLYNAAVLRFTNRGYKNGDLAKLATFAFTPQVIDDHKYEEALRFDERA